PDFAAQIEAQSGQVLGFSPSGALILAEDAAAVTRLARQDGGVLVDVSQARALAPMLTGDFAAPSGRSMKPMLTAAPWAWPWPSPSRKPAANCSPMKRRCGSSATAPGPRPALRLASIPRIASSWQPAPGAA